MVTLLAVSCKNDSPKRDIVNTQQTVSVTTDTTINVTEKTVKTAPRFGCDGKKLKQPKLISEDTKTTPVTISQTKTEIVEVDCQACLEANGVTSNSSGTSNSGSSGSGFWDFLLNWILPILLGLIVLVLIIRGISWLANNPTKRNSNSSSKNESMDNSAANPTRIAALNAMICNLKGSDGKGKGMVKSNHPTEGFEVVAGKVKSSAGVYFKNSGSNVNIYIGDKIHLENSGNTGMPTAEPKKDEPATPAAQA